MKNRLDKLKVGITIGDPSGIGPWICARAVAALKKQADFVIIGDQWVFDKVSGSLGYEFIDLGNVEKRGFRLGKTRQEYGRASVEYLYKALEFIRQGRIDCLVTAPISKEAINLAGFNYSGHTEFFSRNCRLKNIVMMLCNRSLRFSLATRHIPLNDVSAALTVEEICRTTETTYNSLRDLFLIKKPRICVCAFNPHASDNGLIGKEEERIISPAVEKLKKRIPGIIGPLPVDSAVSKAYNRLFDCLIAIYHDQALIPLKITGAETGVNLTLGLEFIRTSPLHGVAFDIAKTSKANPRPMIEAIKLAIKCTRNLKRA